MTLNRWDPFRDLLKFQEKMNRLMDAAFHENAGVARSLARWKPAVDILETVDAYIFRVDLPGVDKDQINIEVKGTLLLINGAREIEPEPGFAAYLVIERQGGVFEQSYRLPGPVDQESTEAKYVDGVLTIVLPKAEEPRDRTLRVTCSQ